MKNYQVRRIPSNFNSNYNHLYVTVKTELSGDGMKEVTFSWQGNTCDMDWYACRAEVNSDNPDTFLLAAKLLKKINVKFGTQPDHVIKCLDEMGYKKVAYHKYLYELFPVDKWPEGKTWTCRAGDHNLAVIVAKTEYDAKRKFRQKAAKAIEKHGSDMQDWIVWLNNGMEVIEVYSEYLPELVSIKLTEEASPKVANL